LVLGKERIVKEMKVRCPRCQQEGDLILKKTVSKGKVYEYLNVAHYVNAKVKWCYLNREYRRILEKNITQITQTLHKTGLSKKNLNLGLFTEKKDASGGVRVWSKETGLGPVGVGLRGFKSHPPHQR
jgi:DNA polymerase II large subunit